MARIRGFEELVRNILEDLRQTEPDLDTKPGTVPRDLIDVFMGRLSESYETISRTSRLQSIVSVSGSELDGLASNYGIIRQGATTSSGIALLTTNSLDFDIPISIGRSVTAVNGVSFNITSSYTMREANKNVYEATATRYRTNLQLVGINDLYAIEVPVEAATAGTSGNISQYSLRRTDVDSIDNVTNVEAFTGASNQEADDQLRQRIVLTLSGNNVGTKDGLESIMLSNTNVVDVYVAVPGDPALQRDGTISGVDSSGGAIVLIEGTGGKVDIYVYGTVGETYTDSFIYNDVTGGGATDSGNARILGTGGDVEFDSSMNRRRLDALSTGGTVPKQPVSSILGVSGSESGANFIQAFTDSSGVKQGNYELLKDTSIGQGGSAFGADKLKFISTEVEISEEAAGKGTFNGQDPLVNTDISEISAVSQDILVVNESPTVESSRSIIRTTHTPIRSVSKVFNVTTGERYTVVNQNVNSTGVLNTTGRVQISGNTLPSATDVLQINYTWNRSFDPAIDFDSLTSLLSTEAYNNLVQDSLDWGFSNTVLEESIPIVVVGGGVKTVTVTFDISRVTSITQDDDEIYSVVDNDGAGFSSNIITLPTNSTASGNVNVEYIADVITIIPETSLTQLPISRDENGFDKVIGNQPVSVTDNIVISDIIYDSSILPEDNLNPWTLFPVSGTTAPDISIEAVSGTDTLVFENSSTAGFYFRTESSIDSTSNIEYSVNMRVVDTIGASWNSDVGLYIDDGTYNIRFVFFTDSSGNKKIGLRNSLAAALYSADTAIDFTAFHTYKIIKDGETDIRLYIDDELRITALYNVSNFITTVYGGTLSFGYFNTTTPIKTEWRSATYSTDTTLATELQLRFAPTQLKCVVDETPSTGIVYINGTTLHRVDKTVTSTRDFTLNVDLSNWTGLTSTQLSNANYKLAKVESLQKIGSDGLVDTTFDLVGSAADLSREYNFSNLLPNEEDNPWSVSFAEADEAEATALTDGTFSLETSGTSSTGPSIYFRTEDHFATATTMSATFRMKISSSTLEAITGSTLESTGVTVWIQNSDVIVPLTFYSFSGTKYVGILKDTSQVTSYADAVTLYQVDWGNFHKYEFEVNKTGNITLGIDDSSPLITIPYVKNQLFDAGSLLSVSSEAIIFGHDDNRPTTTIWDYFDYESRNVEDAKYSLQDNFYDLHLSDENTALNSFTIVLPNTDTNSDHISVGNSIRAILYYTVDNDFENLKFTTNGTLYTNKVFALVDRVSVSSGFTNNSGTLVGTIEVSHANQPETNSSYFADYKYTAPKAGERITVEYVYNSLIGELSQDLEELRPVTADILIREAEGVELDITVDVIPTSGFNLSLITMQQNVQNSLINLLSVEQMGTTLDSSDIINACYAATGVDAVTLITFNEAGELGIRKSFTASGQQYLAAGTITVNIKDRQGNTLQ